MRGVKHVVCAAALAGLVIGCASTSGAGTNPPPMPTTAPRSSVLTPAVNTPGLIGSPSPIGTPATSPSGSTPTTPSALTSPGATTTSLASVTPTIEASPTVTPTPGPPTATATPAPDQATVSAAQDVDAALVAFADAEAKGDAQAMLQTQRKLLDVSANAVSAANQDQSPYGRQLRSALDEVSGASAGNYDQLQDAHKSLSQLVGTLGIQGTPVAVLPRPAPQSQASLPDLKQALQRAVDAYNLAANTGNQSDLLKAQRDLVTAASAADAATKNNRSPLAQQLRKAVTLVNDGLGGDSGKFRDAATALSSIDSGSGQATATANGSADQGHHVDLQPLQNDLDGKLQTLQSSQTSGDRESVDRAANDLKQSIQKATGALANDHSPAANRFRDALGHASEAAAGDTSKIQQARDQLKAALGQ